MRRMLVLVSVLAIAGSTLFVVGELGPDAAAQSQSRTRWQTQL